MAQPGTDVASFKSSTRSPSISYVATTSERHARAFQAKPAAFLPASTAMDTIASVKTFFAGPVTR